MCASAARRFRVAPPTLLLVAGLLLGLIPVLRRVHLPPEAVLLLFLPVLLYWEAFTTSLREIRANLRIIVLSSTLLVAATAGAVAVTAHALGLPWGVAWVMGAAVAPTDATAVGVMGKGLPRRIATMLRAESLVNDGTALVIYGLAVAVTVGEEQFTVLRLGEMFGIAYAGGIAIGVAATWVSVQVRRRLSDPIQHNLLAVVTPLTAYLLAELVHASGVLAVVVSGLWVSHASPRHFPADARNHVRTVMSFATTVLNGALFVLIGVEIHTAIRGLDSVGVLHGLLVTAAISIAVIATRFAFFFVSPYVIRAVDRRPRQRRLRLGARPRTLLAAAGFRGAVSLAAALAVPETLKSGGPFPERDLIVFATAGVIVVTLLVQAPLLPAIIRWAGLGADRDATHERRQAEITTVEEAVDAIPDLAGHLNTDRGVADQVLAEHHRRLQALRGTGSGDGSDPGPADLDGQYAALRLAAVAHQHDTVVRLHDEGKIDDLVLQQIQSDLDQEELNIRNSHQGTK